MKTDFYFIDWKDYYYKVMSSMTAILTCLGLITGNFIYQYFTTENYSLAADRSFFQFMAVLAYWINLRYFV